MKKCKECGEVKDLSSFYFRKDSDTYRTICKICWCNRTSKWTKNNPEKYKEYSNKHANNNRDEIRKRIRVWTKKNLIKKRVSTAKRRANKLNLTPNLDWAEKLVIETLYLTAHNCKLHVDHIKPLSKGGLHHPSNLQLLTPEDNLKKGAKYEEPS